MSNLFCKWKEEGRKALVTFITAGYPSMTRCREAIDVMVDNGADVVEIGIPFSDPIADGPVIQRSSSTALSNCIGIKEALKLARGCRVPVIFISYLNPVLSYGVERFYRNAASSGVKGVILADLIPEHSSLVGNERVPNIFLCSPTCTGERIRLIDRLSTAFIYLVSVKGITGVRSQISGDLGRFVGRVRKLSEKPLYVGFGISSPEQARRVSEVADGVIIGSKIVQLSERRMKRLGRFVKDVKKAIWSSQSR